MSKSPLKKYFEKSAFKANGDADAGPRSKFRQLRDNIKADYYDVHPMAYYKGVKQDVIGEKKTQEQIDAERAKKNVEALKESGGHDYIKSGGDMFDIAAMQEYAKNKKNIT